MKVFDFYYRKRISAKEREELMREYGERKYNPHKVFYLFENPTTMPKLRLFVVSETNPNRIKFLDNGQVIECGEGSIIHADKTMEYMNKGLYEKFGYINDIEKDTQEVERNGHFFNDVMYTVYYGLKKGFGGKKDDPLNVSLREIVEASLYKQQANEKNLELLKNYQIKQNKDSVEEYIDIILANGTAVSAAKNHGISDEEIALIQNLAEVTFKRKAKSLPESQLQKQMEDFKERELAKVCAEAYFEQKEPGDWTKSHGFIKIDWGQDTMPSEDKKDGPFDIYSNVTKDAHKNDGYYFWRVADYLKYQDKVNEVLQEYWPAPFLHEEHDRKSAVQDQDFKF